MRKLRLKAIVNATKVSFKIVSTQYGPVKKMEEIKKVILYCVPCFEVFWYNPIGSDRSDSSVKSDNLDNSGVSDFSLSSIYVLFVKCPLRFFVPVVVLAHERWRSERAGRGSTLFWAELIFFRLRLRLGDFDPKQPAMHSMIWILTK